MFLNNILLESKKTNNISKDFEQYVLSNLYSIQYDLEDLLNKTISNLTRIVQFSKKNIGITRNEIYTENSITLSGDGCYIKSINKKDFRFVCKDDIYESYSNYIWKKNDFVWLDVVNLHSDMSNSLMTSALSQGNFIQKENSSICTDLKIRERLNNYSPSNITENRCIRYDDAKQIFYIKDDEIDLSQKELKIKDATIGNNSIKYIGQLEIKEEITTKSSFIKNFPTNETITTSYLCKNNGILNDNSNVFFIKNTNSVPVKKIMDFSKDFFSKTDSSINPKKTDFVSEDILHDDIENALNGLFLDERISTTEFISKKELDIMLNKLKSELSNIRLCDWE